MLDYILKENNVISELKFTRPLGYLSTDTEEPGHRELAKRYAENNYKCCLVMMTSQYLDEHLYDDPKHMHITNHLIISEVEDEARKQLNQRYYSVEEVDDIFKAKEFPRKTYNWQEDSEREIEHRITDGIFQSQVYEHYHEVIERFKEECRYDYNEETDEEIELSDSEAEARWQIRQKEIFLPRVTPSYERVYPNTPTPFDFWDYRNPWQQYFFVDKGEGKSIEWAKGGSGGSSQRYNNGLLSHTFAQLEKQYGYKIPTYYFEHTSSNEFCFKHCWDGLHLLKRELTGNYGENFQDTKYLFEGKLLDYDYDARVVKY